jgi:hypothetical protein
MERLIDAGLEREQMEIKRNQFGRRQQPKLSVHIAWQRLRHTIDSLILD